MVALLALTACATPAMDSPKPPGTVHILDTASEDSVPSDTDSPSESGESADSGPPPVDADADGAYTPDDCDDTNPRAYPGAYDWCDGVDQDCDGSAQGDGACGEVGVWSELDVLWWEGSEPYVRFGLSPEKMTVEDGQALLGGMRSWHQGGIDSNWGALMVVSGIPDRGSPGPDSAVGVWVGAPYQDNLSSILAGGDVNGDGAEDVWLVSTGQSGYGDGSAFLVLGPSDRWPKVGAYIRDVADGWWLQAMEDDNFGGDQDAGEDIDGDGLADGVFVAWGDIWDGSGGSLHVVRGRPGRLPLGSSISDEITLWKSGDRVDDGDRVRIGPDMDGDGTREVALLAPDYGMGILAGDEITDANGGILADWQTVLLDDRVGIGPGFPNPDAVPGDLDGDGLEELLFGYEWLPSGEGANSSDEACYYYLSGPAALAEGTVGSGIVASACVDHSTTGNEILGDDVDGDGVRDLIVVWTTDFTDALGTEHTHNDSLTCILPSSRLALGGRVEVRDVSLCYYGAIGTTVDLDNDGLSELIFAPSDPVTTYEDAGRMDVLPGFQIPWDAPSKW